MRTLYDRGIGTLQRGEFARGKVRQPRERYQWPLALALGLLLFEAMFPEEPLPWRRRVRPGTVEPGLQEAKG
jgi:hypothetical protein